MLLLDPILTCNLRNTASLWIDHPELWFLTRDCPSHLYSVRRTEKLAFNHKSTVCSGDLAALRGIDSDNDVAALRGIAVHRDTLPTMQYEHHSVERLTLQYRLLSTFQIPCVHNALHYGHSFIGPVQYSFIQIKDRMTTVTLCVGTHERELQATRRPYRRLDAPLGGGKGPQKRVIAFEILDPYILPYGNDLHVHGNSNLFKYAGHSINAERSRYDSKTHLRTNIPIHVLLCYITATDARKIARAHGMSCYRPSMDLITEWFRKHNCEQNGCLGETFFTAISMFRTTDSLCAKDKEVPMLSGNDNIPAPVSTASFPPEPADLELTDHIIRHACGKMSPSQFEEAGCAVCGQLSLKTRLSKLRHVTHLLHLLQADGVTRKERFSLEEPVTDIPGPVLDHRCDNICDTCRQSLYKGSVPPMALARGLWLGEVPEQLARLRYMERVLISRVRHTSTFFRIKGGRCKMKAHAMAFKSPVSKIYSSLPPPRDDLDDIFAILWSGPAHPTITDYQRTPFLVRRKAVRDALHWLRLNHPDYVDINISEENLLTYPEDVPPCTVEWKHSDTNKTPEDTNVNDTIEEDGVEGDVEFTVHGITGEELNSMNVDDLRKIALEHFNNGGKVLHVGQSESAESIWHNPELYPRLFPWLFPYGLGGVGTAEGMSHARHTKFLMLYHDKRFQTDVQFPFVAFSHSQVKAATTSAWLLVEKRKFDEIADRLVNLNQTTLRTLTQRIVQGEKVKPQTPEEVACYKVIHDLDLVAGRVEGSLTSKKNMRNEIWSLIAHRGAPSWYITFAPADNKHPIAIYYADNNESFHPTIRDSNARLNLINRNPVSAARFFHFMVNIFLECVLGSGSSTRGLYGEHAAHYGTVEQQGRLSLHLHLVLWLKGILSLQEIRRRLLDPNSDFQRKIIDYLESVHSGDYYTGSHDEVQARVDQVSRESAEYSDPTLTMPICPPPYCVKHKFDMLDFSDKCEGCVQYRIWLNYYRNTTDDLLLKSNVHWDCRDAYLKKDATIPKCRQNRLKICKGRFPRPTFRDTTVDPDTGGIYLKKREPMMNTFSYPLTYLLRCNTDVTNLTSGTAIKAVIMYITDYITKTPLKTNVLFDAITSTYTKSPELLCGTSSTREKARKILTQTVNLLSTKMEMGSPMIAMYLLGNPDHYTDHHFFPFYWQQFVREARRLWHPEETEEETDKIVVVRRRKRIVGLSPVYDYIYRPKALESMNLYDFIRLAERVKLRSKRQNTSAEEIEDESDNDDWERSVELPDARDSFESDHKNYGQSSFSSSKLTFITGHPLIDSHAIRIRQESEFLVVNFLGAHPPRSDKGDYEYYCSAMLAFFKPWRNSIDLRDKDTPDWRTAFQRYNFTERQQSLMTNFNIRYECLDSRDDYNARMRCNAADGDQLNHMQFEDNVWEHELQAPDGDLQWDTLEEPRQLNETITQPGDIIPSKNYFLKTRERKNMERLVINTKWSTPQIGTDTRRTVEIEPLPSRTCSEWKTLLLEKRQRIIDERMEGQVNQSAENLLQLNKSYWSDSVRVVDKQYFENQPSKVLRRMRDKEQIEQVMNRFTLNQEQERAFLLIANHIITKASVPLGMYIAGMGGTGKSQVLKAVIALFRHRRESSRFMILAPTGTAASLLGGSTYHSVLGINERNTRSLLPKIRQRLRGVHYVFIDEVSMISAREMYKISSRLSQVLNQPELPFGGMNIIFAGDFAQLPPVIGHESGALYSRTIGLEGSSRWKQEQAMGKAAWHHITTVVVLRQNMRQREQTPDDKRFRTALENMRFKRCTPADISFLNSLVSTNIPGQPSVCDDTFRNVPIITAHNSDKDVINELGCQRFAQETGQELCHFYSQDDVASRKDKLSQDTDTDRLSSKSRKIIRIPQVTKEWQQYLWTLPGSTADNHIPARLSLCIGMPVMIRYNIATECSVTRGQEATVYHWVARPGPLGVSCLDVLFVKLKNPPNDIQLDGLPLNVVPITPTTNPTYIRLPSDDELYINRTQVEVVPCFAMTDYSSQGKTRDYNAADINNCKDYHGVYTALSRGSTAKGTIILQGFDPTKITGGLQGAIRQEYRELELLDEITKRRFEQTLPDTVQGDRRENLIRSFRDAAGNDFMPPGLHPSIRWSKKDPYTSLDLEEVRYKLLDHELSTLTRTENDKTKVSSKRKSQESPTERLNDARTMGHISNKVKTHLQGHDRLSVKRKRDDDSNAPSKRIRTEQHGHAALYGPTWNNNSCAYDAILTILYAVWKQKHNPRDFLLYSGSIGNTLLETLMADFLSIDSGEMDINKVRDNLRMRLSLLSPMTFRIGSYASAHDVLEKILHLNSPVMQTEYRCEVGHHARRGLHVSNDVPFLYVPRDQSIRSISQWCRNITNPTAHRCDAPLCARPLQLHLSFVASPPLIAFDLHNSDRPYIDEAIRVHVAASLLEYRLIGVVYFGDSHFNVRILDAESRVWFYDGMLDNGQCQYNGDLTVRNLDLTMCRGKTASIAIYVRCNE